MPVLCCKAEFPPIVTEIIIAEIGKSDNNLSINPSVEPRVESKGRALGALAGRALVRSTSCEYPCLSDSMELQQGEQQSHSLLAIPAKKL